MCAPAEHPPEKAMGLPDDAVCRGRHQRILQLMHERTRGVTSCPSTVSAECALAMSMHHANSVLHPRQRSRHMHDVQAARNAGRKAPNLFTGHSTVHSDLCAVPEYANKEALSGFPSPQNHEKALFLHPYDSDCALPVQQNSQEQCGGS